MRYANKVVLVTAASDAQNTTTILFRVVMLTVV
jgi:hypothetical protein